MNLKRTTEDYKRTTTITNNLTEGEKEGLESLKEKVKNEEVVIQQTDKSGRNVVDSPTNYKIAVEPHITNDIQISFNEYEELEKEMNAHAYTWSKMLQIGKDTNSVDRIKNSLKTRNSDYAVLSCLRKDHKQGFDTVEGPPGRPLCAGNIGYNYRFSHLLCMLLKDIPEDAETECENTEDLIAKIDEVNARSLGDGFIIGSMDVKSLYPSLDIDHTIQIVCKMFETSNVDIEGIDFEEVIFYIAINKSQEEIDQLGLTNLCPKRVSTRGRKPKITGCGTEDSKTKRYAPYVMPDTTTFSDEEQRRLICTALKIALTFVMKNHVYIFDNELRRQKEGGAIGLELTGLLARIYMIWWDEQFLQKCADNQIVPVIYKRSVDDINTLLKSIGPGKIYDGTEVISNREKEERDQDKESDELTMTLLNEIGDSIHPSIQLTIDYPSGNQDSKMPILNLKMWTERHGEHTKVIYEPYRKEVSTKATIHSRSAMGMRQRRSILTQELLTVMTNCSPLLDEARRREHINQYMTRLQFSGYNKQYRYDIYNAAKKAYQKLLGESRSGARPMHRPRQWRRKERKEEKAAKKKTWYKHGGAESVIFVPCTPNEELKQKYVREIRKSGFNIKVVERSGIKIRDALHRKDPFKKKQCDRIDCFVCTSGGKGKGICNKENINYRISCTENCKKKDIYEGETSYSAYTRGQEHLERYNKRDPKSALFNHCINEHQGHMVRFRMDITGTFHRDATLRQISEGVKIGETPQQRLMNTKSEWNSSLIPHCAVQRR